MDILVRFRESLKSIYAEYDIYIKPVLKFALAILVFTSLNNQLGYLNILNNLFVILVLSVICAILPLNGIVVIGMLLIIGHSLGLGVEIGAFALVLYLLMALLYFRFVPEDALAVILTPVAYAFRVPLLVPVSFGLVHGPVSAVSVVLGLVSRQYLEMIRTTIEPLKNNPDTSLLEILQTMPRSLLTKELVLTAITFAVVVLVVSILRKLLSTWNWEVAIGVGAVMYLLLMILGGRILEVEVDIAGIVIETVLSVAAAVILEFFVYNADYAGAEYLQFEDDRYYYHVKAIPKNLPKKTAADDGRRGPRNWSDEVQVPDAEPDISRDALGPEGMVSPDTAPVEAPAETIDLKARLEASLAEIDHHMNISDRRNDGNQETEIYARRQEQDPRQ